MLRKRKDIRRVSDMNAARDLMKGENNGMLGNARNAI